MRLLYFGILVLYRCLSTLVKFVILHVSLVCVLTALKHVRVVRVSRLRGWSVRFTDVQVLFGAESIESKETFPDVFRESDLVIIVLVQSNHYAQIIAW